MEITKSKVEEQTYLEINEDYEINNLLRHTIKESKRYIFQELNNLSLRKIMDYCYANTCYSCCGTDSCYHFTVNDFVKEQIHVRRKTLSVKCKILCYGSRTCDFASCTDCRTERKTHYLLMQFVFG